MVIGRLAGTGDKIPAVLAPEGGEPIPEEDELDWVFDEPGRLRVRFGMAEVIELPVPNERPRSEDRLEGEPDPTAAEGTAVSREVCAFVDSIVATRDGDNNEVSLGKMTGAEGARI
jgi:hypothetical protein